MTAKYLRTELVAVPVLAVAAVYGNADTWQSAAQWRFSSLIIEKEKIEDEG